MTKQLNLATQKDTPGGLRGGLKYYVVGGLLAGLIIFGFAYWVFAYPH